MFESFNRNFYWMKTNEFLRIKTNYIGIGIKLVLFYGILLILIFIELFAFWGIYGEGATATRISNLWYVDLILNYLSILLVGGFLIYKIVIEYKKQEYVKFKTNLITLFFLLFLFSLRNELFRIIF